MVRNDLKVTGGLVIVKKKSQYELKVSIYIYIYICLII